MPDPGTYIGQELDLFRNAVIWKRYWTKQVAPYLQGDVLEVGAGIGSNIPYLLSERIERWCSLEPDPALCSQLQEAHVECAGFQGELEIVQGTIAECDGRTFQAILYPDVLEHIEDDAAEVQRASRLLKAGAYLIVLVPAHNWLMSPFDQSIGHFRRYSRASLLAVSPPDCDVVCCRYLDSVGLSASMVNRFLLRKSLPTEFQIMTWDRWLLPLSKLMDPLLRYTIGKSVLAVWQRN